MMKLAGSSHRRRLLNIRRLFFNADDKSRIRYYSSWIRPNGFETDMTVYNPIEKSKVPIILTNQGTVSWYMCGPTVYDSAHIGHACTYVRFDVIRRILTNFFGINVISVMGITDIDDKIIKRSLETGEEWRQLTKRYEQEFVKEMKLLNVLPPYLYCRVTDYMPQIIGFIEKIFAMNAAYIGKDGSVYFDTTRYGKYGKLQKPQKQPSDTHSVKKLTNDFALWKASKPGEPYWESPWGPGRPGWHIECSAIASTTLGNSIDIHSGGIDLLFPHHENEEAQSCCHHGTDQWVNYWLHTGHLSLPGDEKMSKSLNNAISIRRLLENYSSDEFRMLCLLTHYRTEIEFSHETMQNAVRILNKLEHFLSDCRNYVSGKLNSGDIDETQVFRTIKVTRKKVREAVADDFDTTKAIFAIQELVGGVNKILNNQVRGVKETTSSNRNSSCIGAAAEYVRDTLLDFGISKSETVEPNENQWTDIIDSFVNFRSIVRNRATEHAVKDKFLFEACDQARDNLSACGIVVKDYKNTTTWTLTRDKNRIGSK